MLARDAAGGWRGAATSSSATTAGDYARAAGHHAEALGLRREIGDIRGVAGSLNNLGAIAHDRARYGDAVAYLSDALPPWRQAADQDGWPCPSTTWGARYQLTVIGGGAWARARVVQEIRDRRFVVQTDVPGTRVSWQVTGIRHDPYARWHPIVVEETKPATEQGRYLHPEAYGAAAAEQIPTPAARPAP